MKHSWNVWISPNPESRLPTAAGICGGTEVKWTGAGRLQDGWMQEGGGGDPLNCVYNERNSTVQFWDRHQQKKALKYTKQMKHP